VQQKRINAKEKPKKKGWRPGNWGKPKSKGTNVVRAEALLRRRGNKKQGRRKIKRTACWSLRVEEIMRGKRQTVSRPAHAIVPRASKSSLAGKGPAKGGCPTYRDRNLAAENSGRQGNSGGKRTLSKRKRSQKELIGCKESPASGRGKSADSDPRDSKKRPFAAEKSGGGVKESKYRRDKIENSSGKKRKKMGGWGGGKQVESCWGPERGGTGT